MERNKSIVVYVLLVVHKFLKMAGCAMESHTLFGRKATSAQRAGPLLSLARTMSTNLEPRLDLQ